MRMQMGGRIGFVFAAVFAIGCAPGGFPSDTRNQAMFAEQLAELEARVERVKQLEADLFNEVEGVTSSELTALLDEAIVIADQLMVDPSGGDAIETVAEKKLELIRVGLTVDHGLYYERLKEYVKIRSAEAPLSESTAEALATFLEESYLRGSPRTQAALKAFETFAKTYPDSDRGPELYFALVDKLLATGDNQGAREAYVKIARFYPKNERIQPIIPKLRKAGYLAEAGHLGDRERDPKFRKILRRLGGPDGWLIVRIENHYDLPDSDYVDYHVFESVREAAVYLHSTIKPDGNWRLVKRYPPSEEYRERVYEAAEKLLQREYEKEND